MWGAALRRFGKLLAGAAVAIAAVAALAGLLFGSSLSRSISVAYYCVGSFLLIAGFFIGNRGPLRMKRETADTSFFGPRVMRHATLEEREDSLNNSAVFVALGLALIILGVLADTRYRLI
jgi:uncharacterized membrane protein HdeD (DUF308 family)